MFDEASVEVSGGTLVRLPELSARLAIGEKGPVSHRRSTPLRSDL